MGLPQTRLTKVEAQIPNLDRTVVGVNAEARGRCLKCWASWPPRPWRA